MTGVRVAVAEDRPRHVVIPERRSNPIPDEDAAQRHVARRDALRERDQVRLDAVPLRPPQPARPPEAGDHLVRDQEDVVLPAEARDLGPVVRLRRDDAARPHDRLADERGDLPGTLGEQRAERLDVHDADVDDLVDEVPAVAGLHRADPDERRPPAVHPVVAELARHDDSLLGSADDVPVAADELGGGVDRI